MRLLAGLVLISASCLSRPAFEPIGGFELIDAEKGAAWSELEAGKLAGQLSAARTALRGLHDYEVTLETSERIGDELFPRRVMAVKVRHAPFSVFIETLEPPSEKGQRVWYDESWNHAEILAETPGFLGALVGRLSLDPEGDLALKNRRHPITSTGLLRLVELVDEVFVPELARARSIRARETEFVVGGRVLRLVDALVPRELPDPPLLYRFGFDSGLLTYYGLAELFPDGAAVVEEYLYLDLRKNLGLTDTDFRPPD